MWSLVSSPKVLIQSETRSCSSLAVIVMGAMTRRVVVGNRECEGSQHESLFEAEACRFVEEVEKEIVNTVRIASQPDPQNNCLQSPLAEESVQPVMEAHFAYCCWHSPSHFHPR